MCDFKLLSVTQTKDLSKTKVYYTQLHCTVSVVLPLYKNTRIPLQGVRASACLLIERI